MSTIRQLPRVARAGMAGLPQCEGAQANEGSHECWPVAVCLSTNEALPAYWQQVFAKAMQEGFVPSARIVAGSVSARPACLADAFAQPIGDSILASVGERPGIYAALAQVMESLRFGAASAIELSTIRPSGASVSGSSGAASGPVPHLLVVDRACDALSSESGSRSVAVLSCSHPDIEALLDVWSSRAVRNLKLTVTLPDAFMCAVREGGMWPLTHAVEPGPGLRATGAYQRADGLWVYRTVEARALIRRLLAATAIDDGICVVFPDQTKRDASLCYGDEVEEISGCPRQCLPGYGAVMAGALDLAKIVVRSGTPHAQFDFERLRTAVAAGVRMLDNALDLSHWPLAEQQGEAVLKRRISLMVTGLEHALIALGVSYGSDKGRALAARIYAAVQEAAYTASIELAKERGSFPLFDERAYLGAAGYASRLPQRIRADIRRFGLRNAAILTGSVLPAPGCSSSEGRRLHMRMQTDTACQQSASDAIKMAAVVAGYVESPTVCALKVVERARVRACLEAWEAGVGALQFSAPMLGEVAHMESDLLKRVG